MSASLTNVVPVLPELTIWFADFTPAMGASHALISEAVRTSPTENKWTGMAHLSGSEGELAGVQQPGGGVVEDKEPGVTQRGLQGPRGGPGAGDSVEIMLDAADETVLDDGGATVLRAAPHLDPVADLPAEHLREQAIWVGDGVDGDGVEPVVAGQAHGEHPLRPRERRRVIYQEQVGAGVGAGEQVGALRGGGLRLLRGAAHTGGLDVVGQGGVVGGAAVRGARQLGVH